MFEEIEVMCRLHEWVFEVSGGDACLWACLGRPYYLCLVVTAEGAGYSLSIVVFKYDAVSTRLDGGRRVHCASVCELEADVEAIISAGTVSSGDVWVG